MLYVVSIRGFLRPQSGQSTGQLCYCSAASGLAAEHSIIQYAVQQQPHWSRVAETTFRTCYNPHNLRWDHCMGARAAGDAAD
jgi:hypothetical protein